MRLIPLLLLGLFLQDPPDIPLAWKLAKNEFASYNASLVSFDEGGEEIVKDHPQRLAGLFGYEITEKSAYRPQALDRDEIPLILGLSLPPKPLKPGQSHEWTVEIEESFDCGPVTAKCSATRRPAADIDGIPVARIDIAAKLSKGPRPAPRAVQKGELDATLYFDPARGVALRLDFRFQLTIAPADPKGVPETIDSRERLDYIETRPIRHRKFEADVNAAIDKGIGLLWRRYKAAEGHWGAHYDHKTGPTALALLAILKGNVDRKDERLVKAFDWMLSQPFQHTYEVAISIMAVEAWYSPAEKNSAPPAPSPDHAKWCSSAAQWLELNLAKGMWSYPSTDVNARDFSNTQYGVLGLYSAWRCGIAPDASLVRRLQETYLRAQQKKGPRAELALADTEAAGKTQARYVVEARGWTYYDNQVDHPYGSMTAGGIASLVILDALRKKADPKYDVREQNRVRAAIRDGWGWIAERWTVKGNPARGRHWLYYYLYGLERCGMLDGVARVGDHDWYGEGANFLVANQRSDGAWFTDKWVHTYDNCFAILFLKRATVRVATGK